MHASSDTSHSYCSGNQGYPLIFQSVFVSRKIADKTDLKRQIMLCDERAHTHFHVKTAISLRGRYVAVLQRFAASCKHFLSTIYRNRCRVLLVFLSFSSHGPLVFLASFSIRTSSPPLCFIHLVSIFLMCFW